MSRQLSACLSVNFHPTVVLLSFVLETAGNTTLVRALPPDVNGGYRNTRRRSTGRVIIRRTCSASLNSFDVTMRGLNVLRLTCVLLVVCYHYLVVSASHRVIDEEAASGKCQLKRIMHTIRHEGCATKKILSYACHGECPSYAQVSDVCFTLILFTFLRDWAGIF